MEDPPVEQGRKSALVTRHCRPGMTIAQWVKATLGLKVDFFPKVHINGKV